jgi:hypothetical protein
VESVFASIPECRHHRGIAFICPGFPTERSLRGLTEREPVIVTPQNPRIAVTPALS